WMPASRGQTALDKDLYTDATVALDARTGKLKWYFQHAPAEAFDMDEAFERVLVDVDNRPLVFSIGKHGILWKLDRRTGEVLDARETVYQAVVRKIDPKTGATTFRQDIIDKKVGQWIKVCPSKAGGHDWPAMSYHPETARLIIPLVPDVCFEQMGRAVELKE